MVDLVLFIGGVQVLIKYDPREEHIASDHPDQMWKFKQRLNSNEMILYTGDDGTPVWVRGSAIDAWWIAT